ncbi:hypothetical protein JHK82_030145 [Glycine max]|nr:hypothetical protein JHK85_030770 [Glycine max]KAG4993406.1 hypothetical protein JHK86_030233 [Glycine max]KAG5123408.1 hypothetical protein JHK82_030145 [Glycine max]
MDSALSRLHLHNLPPLSSAAHRPLLQPLAAAASFYRSSPPLPRLRLSPLLAANTLTANDVSLVVMVRVRVSVKMAERFEIVLIVERDRERDVSPYPSDAILMPPSLPRSGLYTVGDFMTKKEDLHVVKPTTSVDEALEILVENRITGFPVIDDNWKLVGVVSDYDLLALDSISGHGLKDNNMFPEVDSTWKTFNEVQKLLSKTNGKLIGELMTTAPMVVRETTNLEDAARLLLETKFRRLPVVDAEGRLVGIITRGNVVRAALHMKQANQKKE